MHPSSPGVAALIDEAIRDGNKITVLTALPRPIAILILKKSGLSPLFQGRIDPENLISPLHLADFKTISMASAADAQAARRANADANNRIQAQVIRGGSGYPSPAGERNMSLSVSSLGDREGQRFDGAAVIKCCGLMRKPGGKISGGRNKIGWTDERVPNHLASWILPLSWYFLCSFLYLTNRMETYSTFWKWASNFPQFTSVLVPMQRLVFC